MAAMRAMFATVTVARYLLYCDNNVSKYGKFWAGLYSHLG